MRGRGGYCPEPGWFASEVGRCSPRGVMGPEDQAFERAAAAIRGARALVVATGAGMGVDSGLPDFRGDQGFWNAYPVYERLGLSFVDAANPDHFDEDPAFGWGFYGHRLHLYRETVPHDGYRILRSWMEDLGLPAFVVTSNVDGQFQKAGFDPALVHEVHGSIHHLQCTLPCGDDDLGVPRGGAGRPGDHAGACGSPPAGTAGGWPGPTSSCSATGPGCPGDRARRRDGSTPSSRSTGRRGSRSWSSAPARRWPPSAGSTERLGRTPGSTVIRVNPREADIRAPHLGIRVRSAGRDPGDRPRPSRGVNLSGRRERPAARPAPRGDGPAPLAGPGPAPGRGAATRRRRGRGAGRCPPGRRRRRRAPPRPDRGAPPSGGRPGGPGPRVSWRTIRIT